MWFSFSRTYDPALVQIRFDQSVDDEQGCITNHANCPPAIPVRMWFWFADVHGHGIIKSQFRKFKTNAMLFKVACRLGRVPFP
jgi:hypothetical protein